MAVLRAGGSAVDGVETAIKVLEDREITNSGYGSNLGFDGVVECDAILVDPLGRSGAVGAVSRELPTVKTVQHAETDGLIEIKNPISLARLLLDHSTQALSLRRVPPNLLVGQGATQFAEEHGMKVLHHEALISPFAKHRWQKWRADLAKAERHKQREEAKRQGMSPVVSEPDLTEYFGQNRDHENSRKTHERNMIASLYNDAQPVSPPPSDNVQAETDCTPGQPSLSSWSLPEEDDTKDTTPDHHPDEYIDPDPLPRPNVNLKDMTHHPFANSTQKLAPTSALGRVASQGNIDGEQQLFDVEFDDFQPAGTAPTGLPNPVRLRPADSDSDDTAIPMPAAPTSKMPASPPPPPVKGDSAFILPDPSTNIHEKVPASSTRQQSINVDGVSSTTEAKKNEDHITDTVGAIAIDMYGNIACGASSGGIGMKHRGRIGPAALVGVGATVIPVDMEDEDRTTVATVTSGTGEHMSTTMAASVCSERVFHNVRKVSGSGVRECMEEEAVRGFIQKDFMGHPSVKHSDSDRAIGMLSVKKTKDGAWLYFGHNTDSFALASMHSDEMRPVCTMSRSNGNGSIAQGGRGIRYRKKR